MSPESSPATYMCVVCNVQAEAAMTAECNWCDRRFHLNQRNDVEAPDCGQVWIDEQYLALQFACNICLIGTDRALMSPEAPGTSDNHPRTAPKQPPTARLRRYKRRA